MLIDRQSMLFQFPINFPQFVRNWGKSFFATFQSGKSVGKNVIFFEVAANLVFGLGKFGEFTPLYKREKSLKWLEKPNYFNQNIGVFTLSGR